MSKMEDEFSIALFEDGRKEIIPKSWIQGYLKEEDNEEGEDCTSEMMSNSAQETSGQGNHSYSDFQYPLAINPINEDIIKKTLLIVTENKNALTKLQKSIDKLICIATGEPEPEVNISQPAEHLNEFLALEEHIKIKENYDELVTNLSKIGGKTVESTTRKTWNRLCTTPLASSICWTGANGKYCLKGMVLNRLVRDAVLITHPQGKEADIQRATMLWFSHAQDRLRARKSQ